MTTYTVESGALPILGCIREEKEEEEGRPGYDS